MSSSLVPKKLAIFYGWPSTVNGAGGNVATAVDTYKNYDLLVLGDGLQLESHADHSNTVSIINHVDMVNTTVFGYIDSTSPLDTVQTSIDQWKAMGVKGIFLDKFGYDFGVIRTTQRVLVWCVQAKGLKTFVNAWNPDDVFSTTVHATNNPLGLPTRLTSNDWYLAESFAIMNGAYDDGDVDSNNIKDFQDKAIKMSAYKTTYGVNMAAVTTSNSDAFDQNKADYSYYAAVLNNFDAWGWGEEFFSAASSLLPMRSRKTVLGTSFIGPISYNAGVIQRNTNIGVHVNTDTHVVSEQTT